MSVFTKFFLIKLLLGTLFIFVWTGCFPSLRDFFNPVMDSYDSLRYNHDAWVFATGGNRYFGEILTNPVIVIYGGWIYRYTFLHPWWILFFNTWISACSSWVLYKSFLPFLSSKKMKEIFWLSQLMPVFIAYEAILGKEVFYLAGDKLLLAFLIRLFFHKQEKSPAVLLKFPGTHSQRRPRGWKRGSAVLLGCLLIVVILLAYIRTILLPFLFLGILCYYLKPAWFLMITLVTATLVFLSIDQDQLLMWKELNRENGSSNPVFQWLRVFLLSESPWTNSISGLLRYIIYLVYPFPLVLPDIFKLMGIFKLAGIHSEQMCTRLLTVSEQVNFWWQVLLLGLLDRVPVKSFTADALKIGKYLFWFSMGNLLFFAESFPLLHARYRIFFFTSFVGMIWVVKRKKGNCK
jgi:hypothetical protein